MDEEILKLMKGDGIRRKKQNRYVTVW